MGNGGPPAGESQGDLASRILKDGLLRASDLAPGVPARIGRYEVQRPLGSGAAGDVYLARDPGIGREVAIKVLRGSGERILQRFRREIRILAAVDHPSIVRIYDTGTHEGRPYAVMEYVAGPSFRHAHLALPDALRVIADVAGACHAAHEAGAIHRDLKPENIILGDRPVIVDFGLGRFLEDDAGLTAAGTVLGTPAYMAPEQARGNEADRRTDVYALGVMLYETLTGRVPHEAPTFRELVERIAQGEPAPPRSIDPAVPAEMERVCLKAMSKDPAERYPTAGDLAADIETYLDGIGAGRRPAAATSGLWTWLAGSATILACGAILLWALRSPPTTPSRRAAAPEPPPAAGPPAGDRTAPALPAEVPPGPEPAPPPAGATTPEAGAAAPDASLVEACRLDAECRRSASSSSYLELIEAASRVSARLDEGAIRTDERRRALLCVARVRGLVGFPEDALPCLDEAIGLGQGPLLGDCLLERAFLRWDAAVLQVGFERVDEASRQLRAVEADLALARDLPVEDAWRQTLGAVLRAFALHTPEGLWAALQDLAVEASPGASGRYGGDASLLVGDIAEAVRRYQDAGAAGDRTAPAHLALAMRRSGAREEDVLRVLLDATGRDPFASRAYAVWSAILRDGVVRTLDGRRALSSDLIPYLGQASSWEGSHPRAADPPVVAARASAWLGAGLAAYRSGGDGSSAVVNARREFESLPEDGEAGRLRSLGVAMAIGVTVAHGDLSATDRPTFLGRMREALDRASGISPGDPEVASWANVLRGLERLQGPR